MSGCRGPLHRYVLDMLIPRAGGLKTKHGEWLIARRWSVLLRSGETSSLSEAVDLSLSSMGPSTCLTPVSVAGGGSLTMPSSKLAVIAEMPCGIYASESDDSHGLHYDVSEGFPRASRQASTATGAPLSHEDVEVISGGGPSAHEANSTRDLSSPHESRWDVDDSIDEKGSPSTIDILSHCASQDAHIREELGICRAGEAGFSYIMQARTHQWVSRMPILLPIAKDSACVGGEAVELPSNSVEDLRLRCLTSTSEVEGLEGKPPTIMRLGSVDM